MKICIIGPSTIGKSTSANYLVSKYEFNLIKLAQPLYDIQNYIYDYMGLKIERYQQDGRLLQDLANNIMRLDPCFLYNNFCNKTLSNRSANMVNDDCRKDNIDKLKDNGWVIVQILGPLRNRDSDITKPKELKESLEREWENDKVYKYVDFIIKNNSTVEDLHKNIDDIMGVLNVVNRE